MLFRTNIYRASLLATVAILAGVSARPASAEIRAYLSAPSSQYAPTSYTNTVTNDFEAFTTGLQNVASTVTGVGTYQFSNTNPAQIVAANSPVAYLGSNTGKFLGLGQAWTGVQNTLTLNFSSTMRYFGMSWSAGDSSNTISFYNGGDFIASYSTAQITSILDASSGATVTALDGSSYNKSAYKGIPAGPNGVPAGGNSSENYTYLNFLGIDQGFDRVVFSSQGLAGFESDNHTVSVAPQVALGAFVPAGSIGVVVPEANTLALFALPALGMVATVIRRRK